MIIFLNGTSSSGKTSIARKLQDQHPTPLLHVGIDTFYYMLPEDFVGHEEKARLGYFYEMEDERLKKVHIGPYAQKLLQCCVPTIKQLVDCGNDLVVDEILFEGEGRTFLAEYADAFVGQQAYFVKVACPLDVLEEREATRPDRHRGIAALQFDSVHAHGHAYDIEVDTSQMPAPEAARFILDQIKKEPEPMAFEAIRRSRGRSS